MSDKTQSEFTYKFFNFDLDTKELLKIFKDTRKPYIDLKKFFLERDFEHRQYSGYLSNQLLDRYDIADIAEELGQNFKWLKSCIQKADVSNVLNKDETDIKGQIYDAIDSSGKNYVKNKEQEAISQTQRKHAELEKEVKYYQEHKNSFLTEARKRTENKIATLLKDLITEGEKVSDEAIKTLNDINKARSGRSF